MPVPHAIFTNNSCQLTGIEGSYGKSRMEHTTLNHNTEQEVWKAGWGQNNMATKWPFKWLVLFSKKGMPLPLVCCFANFFLVLTKSIQRIRADCWRLQWWRLIAVNVARKLRHLPSLKCCMLRTYLEKSNDKLISLSKNVSPETLHNHWCTLDINKVRSQWVYA